jgi:hypothetical protein
MFWGIALGAAGAFLFDPQHGPRRRAQLREKWQQGVNDTREFADAAKRDPRERNRAFMGGAAGVLFLYGLVRGGLGGLGAIVLGSAVLARAVGDRPAGELVEEAREKLSS